MKNFLEKSGPFLALAVLLAVCVISGASFRNPYNYLIMAQQASYTGLIAVGMTLIIAAGGIDLSVGSLFAFCGVAALKLAEMTPGSPTVIFFATLCYALIFGALGGTVNGTLVTVWRIPPFIVTLGSMSIFRSLALYWADAGRVVAHNPHFSCLSGLLTVGIFVVLAALAAVMLQCTPFGRHICAVGSQEKVALYAGIRTGRTQFATYLLTGVLCGVASFLWAGRMNGISSSSDGAGFELDAIAAVIVGGTAMSGGKASIPGTIAGVLILTLLANALVVWGVSPNLKDLVKGLVIVTAVLLQYKKGRKIR